MSEHEAGPELAARVAVEVMGSPVFTATDPEWRTQLHRQGIQYVRFISPPIELRQYDGMRFVKNWRPDEDITAAWEVVEWMREQGGILQQRFYGSLIRQVKEWSKANPSVFLLIDTPPGWWLLFYADAPLAICRAALAATETGVDTDSETA